MFGGKVECHGWREWRLPDGEVVVFSYYLALAHDNSPSISLLPLVLLLRTMLAGHRRILRGFTYRSQTPSDRGLAYPRLERVK